MPTRMAAITTGTVMSTRTPAAIFFVRPGSAMGGSSRAHRQDRDAVEQHKTGDVEKRAAPDVTIQVDQLIQRSAYDEEDGGADDEHHRRGGHENSQYVDFAQGETHISGNLIPA